MVYKVTKKHLKTLKDYDPTIKDSTIEKLMEIIENETNDGEHIILQILILEKRLVHPDVVFKWFYTLDKKLS